MSIIQIREAQREGARLVIGIAGQSGTGKTYSALQLALGLANGRSDKVGLLDTENKRGSLYADILASPFLIADLLPPFSPARYAQAIREFEQAGIEVLVIDSVSHEWEGEGGCEDIATNTEAKIADWKRAKYEHKKFVRTMLQCDMHIVACIRAREKTDFRNPKQPVSLGIQPICEKNFMYEMTASLLLDDAGQSRKLLKCPSDLLGIFDKHGYITPEDGAALRDYVAGAKQLDPALERAKNNLTVAAGDGTAAFHEAWKATAKPLRDRIRANKGFLDTLEASVKAFDAQHALEDIPERLLDIWTALKEELAEHGETSAREYLAAMPAEDASLLQPHFETLLPRCLAPC